MKQTLLLFLLLTGHRYSLNAQSIQIGNATCSPKYVAVSAGQAGNCSIICASTLMMVPAGTVATYDMYPGGTNTPVKWMSSPAAAGALSFLALRLVDPASSPCSYNLGHPDCAKYPTTISVPWPCTERLSADWSDPTLVKVDIR